MRKILLLTIGFFSLVIPLHAQLSQIQISNVEKMEDGFTVELTASPFNPSYSLLAPGYIRVRKILSESAAFRLGLWGNVSDNQIAPESVENTWLVSIRPGYEFHFEGGEKVTPYVGADLVFDMKNSQFESSTNPSLTGALDVNGRERSYWQAGLQLVSGFDYHLGTHFYMGMEVGFQYAYRQNAEILQDGVLLQGKTTSNHFNTVFSNSIRVGFKLY